MHVGSESEVLYIPSPKLSKKLKKKTKEERELFDEVLGIERGIISRSTSGGGGAGGADSAHPSLSAREFDLMLFWGGMGRVLHPMDI